jgi:hypothetical protein
VETTSLAATPALASCADAAVHDDPRGSALIHLLNFGAIRRFRLWNLPLMGGRCQRRACEIAGREVVPWPASGPSAGLRRVCARAGAELSVLCGFPHAGTEWLSRRAGRASRRRSACGLVIQAAAANAVGGSWQDRNSQTVRRRPCPQAGQHSGSMPCLARQSSRSAM